MQHIVTDRPENPDRLPPARRIRRVATGVGLIGFSALLVPEEIVDAPTIPAINRPETSTRPASPAPGQSGPGGPGPTATPGAGTVAGCPRPAAPW